jgi:hypothetical protein
MSRMTGIRFSVNVRLSPLPGHPWNPPNLASAGHQEFLQSECEPDHASPFNINVENIFSFTSTPLHASLAGASYGRRNFTLQKWDFVWGYLLLSCSAYTSILNMAKVHSSKTSVCPHQTTRRHVREDRSLQGILSLVASSLDNTPIFTISKEFPLSSYFERQSWKITVSLNRQF